MLETTQRRINGESDSFSAEPYLHKRDTTVDPKALLLSLAPLVIAAPMAKRRPWALIRIRNLVTTLFHMLYHASERVTWANTYWLGLMVKKCPLDLWIYQEILFETRPDVIIETGTYKGGSALFFASLFDLMKHGRVITIDLEDRKERPSHGRITYLTGSSTSEAMLETVRSLIRGDEKVMVSLDSNHTKDHVLKELKLYSQLVTASNYLIVEDTNLNGHPVMPESGEGPLEAVEEFLEDHRNFTPDLHREKFALTFNHLGYLKRIE